MVQVYGNEELQHPYSYVLFLGVDARGDMLPCRQLRDKYNVPRRDVYAPGQEEDEEGGGDEEEGGDGGGGGSSGGRGGDDEPKGEGSSSSSGNGSGSTPSGQKTIPGIDMSSLQ